MKNTLLLASLIAGLSCCGGKSESASTPMTVSGSVSLGGNAQEVGSCAMTGSGVSTALTLKLKSGAIVTLPIHESTVLVQANADASQEKLSCATHTKKGGGSSSNYEGDIALSCGEGNNALEMDLSIRCGVAAPSNRSPDEEGPPN